MALIIGTGDSDQEIVEEFEVAERDRTKIANSPMPSKKCLSNRAPIAVWLSQRLLRRASKRWRPARRAFERSAKHGATRSRHIRRP
jgi:hypothetical protein